MTILARIPLSPDAFRAAVGEMKSKLLAVIEQGGGSVTFGDFAKSVEGFHGGVLGFGHGGFNNWFYLKLTAVGCAAMCELVKDGEAFVVPTMPEDYDDDEHKPSVPIQRGLAPSKRQRWIPCRVESKAHCTRKGACLAQNIFVSEAELGRCLHFEATMPLVQDAIDELNRMHRDAFFGEEAAKRGTPLSYDLYYTVGSSLIEIFDATEFTSHLKKVAEANPHLVSLDEIDALIANPIYDDKHFQKLTDVMGPDFGITDYRVVTEAGAPVAIRRIRMSQTDAERLVGDLLDSIDKGVGRK